MSRYQREATVCRKLVLLYVTISVDTESSDSPLAIKRFDLFAPMVYGQIENSYWGVPKIMELCDHYACKATFFVSVFEYKKYGEDGLSQLCADIKQKGHDVQLHIHPIWDYGKRYMHEYSLQDQIQIVDAGKKLLKKWVAEAPIAHRAGVYGADEDTLKALKENGIPIDSSNFYGNRNCHLSITRNKIVEKHGVIEMPVTVFQRNTCMTFGFTKFTRRRGIVKTDVNWASLDELLEFVKQAKAHNLAIMNFFLHSYSFLKFDPSLNHFLPDTHTAKEFESFLSTVTKDAEIKIITVSEFYDRYCRAPTSFANGSDFVPMFQKNMNLMTAIGGKLKLSARLK